MPASDPDPLDTSDLPYSQRPDWRDVTPVPQEDGPLPLVVINYPPGFQEVHSYFRAIQQLNEYSARALALTGDVIEANSANYTAWWYRRRCLKEMDGDLAEELEFTDKWASDCPKNYQVWYHRRWLIAEMAERCRKSGISKSEADAEIHGLAMRELAYHEDCMQLNDDFKNYNGWSHRQYIVQKFNLWSEEMRFVEGLLKADIRNNSAWNHRFTVIKNTCWPPTDDVRTREVQYALASLRSCVKNESAWNYLAAFFGQGEGKKPWDSNPDVEAFCREVLAAPSGDDLSCRFAAEALAQVHEARGEIADALQMYKRLMEQDRIRSAYWAWRSDLVRKRAPTADAA